MATNTKLPKWFLDEHPAIYTESEEVQNPFSGACYTLTGDELSMYNYIIWLQWVIDRRGGVMSPATFPLQKQMRKGLDWFRSNNAKAYMVLLD
jgi:hypothetical protein